MMYTHNYTLYTFIHCKEYFNLKSFSIKAVPTGCQAHSRAVQTLSETGEVSSSVGLTGFGTEWEEMKVEPR